MRVEVSESMLRWARERSGKTLEELHSHFPKLAAWESGESMPTFKQLEALAKATYTPIGFLFLPEPPTETVPIPDFRTVGGQTLRRPSPNLLDTIHLCQQRQDWYREYAQQSGEPQREFVGSVDIAEPVESVAEKMRSVLHFDMESRRTCPTWTDALREFINQADEIGVLVMCSGVVGCNNRRRLNPDEFRGFALADALAPLVFINGADTKAAQMFTLAHELAHLWLGQSALSNAGAYTVPNQAIESWCNRVAAELLAPLQTIRAEYRAEAALQDEVNRLARRFKVSTLVVLRRLFDARGISKDDFERAYSEEEARIRAVPKGSGGDFYLTQAARVSKRFARALFVSALEGQTLYRDAFRMLNISRSETFNEMGRSLGVAL